MAEPAPDLARLPLNCPRCGQPLRYLHARTATGEIVADREAADASTVYVYQCPQHGPFRFSVDVPVKPGA